MPRTIRTSETDPIRIASISPGPSFGRIGITFCPGKKDPAGGFAHWDRDLATDLNAIRDWGAATIITLIEEREIKMLKVPMLGAEVLRRQMNWWHLPIADVSVPNETTEAEWQTQGEGIRAVLRAGFNVVFHCRGGLGRAGTMAARIVAELGLPPSWAVEEVRRVRPGAIETSEQEDVVRCSRPMPELVPDTSPAAVEDRAVGALLGLTPRDSCDPIKDMVGGGPFRLEPGQWTDDTSMALALAESHLEKGDLDEKDLMGRFVQWWREGRYSCTGRCFDIGNTTRAALERWLKTGDPIAGSTAASGAGNGSLMRLAPVALRYWNNHEKLRDVASRQSRTTHAATEAVDACIAFAGMLADAIAGKPRSEVLRPRGEGLAATIAAIVDGSWRGKRRSEIKASGYVAHTLEAAVWSVARTADFKSAVLLAGESWRGRRYDRGGRRATGGCTLRSFWHAPTLERAGCLVGLDSESGARACDVRKLVNSEGDMASACSRPLNDLKQFPKRAGGDGGQKPSRNQNRRSAAEAYAGNCQVPPWGRFQRDSATTRMRDSRRSAADRSDEANRGNPYSE
jgi:ADP-ribosyl-[dinitrogen reductase] hydrolase